MKDWFKLSLYLVPCIVICVMVVKYANLFLSFMGGGSIWLWGLIVLACLSLCASWIEELDKFFLLEDAKKAVKGINDALESGNLSELLKGEVEPVLNKKQLKTENEILLNLEDDVRDRVKSDGRIEPKL